MMLWALVLLLGFDPAASMRAFQHDEARPGAIRQLLRLKGDELKQARENDALQAMLSLMSGNAKLDLESRILSLRAMARLGCKACAPQIGGLLLGKTPEETALAREAAVALTELKAFDVLAAGVKSEDPEIRAQAANYGTLSSSERCAMLKASWPLVRLGAARGLAHDPERGCLAEALEDRDPSVRRAAADAAGGALDGMAEGNVVKPTDEAKAKLLPLLEARAADRREKLEVRQSALIALGRLGSFEKAQKILAAHLQKGGLSELTEAAIFAIAQHQPTKEEQSLLQEAVDSKDCGVAYVALRALYAHDPVTAVEIYQKRRPKLNPGQQEQMERLIAAQKPRRELGDVDERESFVDGKPVEDEDWE